MARLQRGKIRHERYEMYLCVITTALMCALAGEEEIFLVLAAVAAEQLRAYEDLVQPTTLAGVYPDYDFMEVIGGFDFKELFRFEKPDFLLLLEELELPNELEISR